MVLIPGHAPAKLAFVAIEVFYIQFKEIYSLQYLLFSLG